MKLYLSFYSIPEIKALPPELRRKQLQNAYTQSLRHWQMWVALFIAIVLGSVGALISVAITDGLTAAIIGGGFAGGLGMFIYIQILARTMRLYLTDRTARS